MRHSKFLKEKVQRLRQEGWSLNQLYNETGVPKTTIRLWTSQVKLTREQNAVLKLRTHKALQEGRIKAQNLRKERLTQKMTSLMSGGKSEVGKLSAREFFLVGIGLYWGEGFKNKHEHRLGFCNSDPHMIRFYLTWLEKLGVKKEDIVARLTLNISYKDRVREIEKYWESLTGIPVSQFTKTFYQNSIWKKQFNTDAYHGVLRIHVKDSLDILLKMKGWLEGLKTNLPG